MDAAPAIRHATPEDLDAVVELIWQVAAEGRWLGAEAPFDRGARRERLARAVQDPSKVLLVAADAVMVVGELTLEVAPYGVADLGMAILDGWREAGLGRRLLDAGIGWAKEAGAHKLALEVWPDNARAIALYERAGFMMEGRKQAHYRRRSGDRWDVLIMGLALQPPVPFIRPARDTDSWDLVALVAACWAEYAGCVLDVHGECPDLLAPASAYAAKGGAMWVVDGPSGLAASVALAPAGPGIVDIQRLYVARRARRRGLARRMVARAESEAARRGAQRIEAWSDTRFVEAHRFYAATGYAATGVRRELGDLSATTEEQFVKLVGQPAGPSGDSS